LGCLAIDLPAGIPETRAITGGVDTHADTNVAAALDPVGGLLGVREFSVTAAGYAGLLGLSRGGTPAGLSPGSPAGPILCARVLGCATSSCGSVAGQLAAALSARALAGGTCAERRRLPPRSG
jgi:hypothetical protein